MGDIPRVVRRLPKYAKLSWLLLRDPHLSAKHRAALIAALGYSISPIDAVPGIIPVIGQLDDLAVVLFAVLWILRTMPSGTAESYLKQSGLDIDTLETDLRLVKGSGKRVLKRTLTILGLGTAVALGLAKIAGARIIRAIASAGPNKRSAAG